MPKLLNGSADSNFEKPRRNIRAVRIQVLVNCILMSGVVLGLCFYTSGMFYDSVAAGLGLSSSEMSLTTSFYLVALALGTMILPRLIEKVPYRYLFQIGAAVSVVSTLLMSFCFGRGFLYTLSFVQGLGCSLIGLVPVTTILNNWFYKRNDWFTALALAFPALVASFCGPLFSGVISALGWRMSYVLMAVLIAAFLAWGFMDPIMLTPEEGGYKPYGIRDLTIEEETVHKSAKTSLMVMILIAVCGAILIALPLHFGGYASSMQLGLIIAGRMLSWAMIGNIIFKLAGGLISEKFGIYRTTAGLALIAFIASLGFAIAIYHYNNFALYTFSFLFGAVYAISELSLPLLVRQRFGRLRFLTVYSMVHACSLIVSALSVYLIGVLVDAAGTYLWCWIAAAVLLVLIEVLLFWASGGMKPLEPVASHEKKTVRKNESAVSAADDRAYEVSDEGPSSYESPSFYYGKKQEEARQNSENTADESSPAVISEVPKTFNASASSLKEDTPYSFDLTDHSQKSAGSESSESEIETSDEVARKADPAQPSGGVKISVTDAEAKNPMPEFGTKQKTDPQPALKDQKPEKTDTEKES